MISQKTVILTAAIIVVVGLMVLIAVRSGNSQDVRPGSADQGAVIRYLPLGDSYTIGQSVPADGRWPYQLAAGYRPAGKRLIIVANPAVTGYTSQDLIDRELPLLSTLQPDFVSVQIGVNDYVQGVSKQVFEANLRLIIETVQQKLAQPTNLLLVTIPDYALTPVGAGYGDPVAASAAIKQFNDVITANATTYGVPVADIYGISQGVTNDPGLTAGDGLHPSTAQYELWVDQIQQVLTAAGIPRT